ncbi:MAG: IS200/IS605 family transposase [Bacteroidetes bacterium]|jgi:putative transposase|nr:IS200/IS605 family transposase [Bacteroidota bacterium]MBT7039607.1 IS200/IS605 family transposase [Bacteroidota bacterium]
MPQSLIRNYIHITFSTKNRFPFIIGDIEPEIHNYIGGICKKLECNPIIVGGHFDHVHLLCLLSQKIALMNLIQKIKSNSSSWIKTKSQDLFNFYWQDGYGAFSVNPSEIEIVKNYIEKQHEHHKTKTFKEEYLSFLKKYEVEYDEKYIWD